MTTTPAELSGLFKEAYASNIMNLVPEVAKVIKMVPFIERDKEEGNKYHQPVIVSNEHGFTYAAAAAGAFALNSSISLNMQDAQVEGSQILLRSALSYDAAAKASNSKKAFVKATELLVENMMESSAKRLEISCIYGRKGLGTTASSANIGATSTTITVTTAKWATGIWSGSETAEVNFYISNTTLVSSSADAIFTVTSVNANLRTMVITGTSTGITALDIAIAANADDVDIYFRGSFGVEMNGLDAIMSNTTGTLFNISATTYNLWAGNTYTAGSAQLTMGKILAAVSKAVQRGLNEKVCALLNPDTWANVNSDLAALRQYDGSYRREKGENGVENITFYHQNGAIELISHNCIKEGEALIFPPKKVRRLGAQDISFKTPGREDEIFLHLPSNAGFELRTYTDQAIFIETPARTVKITDIVNA